MLVRSKYRSAPEPDTALWIRNYYTDQYLTREEIASVSCASDVYHGWWLSISTDNGRSWSEPEPVTESMPGIPLQKIFPAGGMVVYPQVVAADPCSGKCYRFYMQRLFPGAGRKPFEHGNEWKSQGMFDHVFVTEQGGTPRMLRYEDGPECDWEQPFRDDYCRSNMAYFGVNAEIGQDGTVLFPLAVTARQGNLRNSGVCLMRRDPSSGLWLSSNVVFINPDWSSRGLLEPSVARLRNGTIMVICRGSDTPNMPGRKWFVYSTDNGRTLSEVQELCYDDGSQFYSPSSMHRLIRSTCTGDLYWIANIVAEPPRKNQPRYPLVITRMDEERMAVIKTSMEKIDDKTPGDPDVLQLSNFCALEDRETRNIEIFMTRWGENPASKWQADVYRYIYFICPNKSSGQSVV